MKEKKAKKKAPEAVAEEALAENGIPEEARMAEELPEEAAETEELPEESAEEPDDVEDEIPEEEDPCEEPEELLSEVLEDNIPCEENRAELMAVVVDYAFKREKIKKGIRKASKKTAAKYGLEETENSAPVQFAADYAKELARRIQGEYGENAQQSLTVAYTAGLYVAGARKREKDAFKKKKKKLADFLCETPGLENLPRIAPKKFGDKKGKWEKPLNDYLKRLSAEKLWDNIDESMKRKALKEAFLLGAMKAVKG